MADIGLELLAKTQPKEHVMKITAQVKAVRSGGDMMTVELIGKPAKSASWRLNGTHSLDIPATEKAKAAFHIGRKVELFVKVK